MSFVSLNKNITRNYGIDVLRILAMLGIVTLHTLYHGQIVATSSMDSVNYYLSTLLLTIAWCGVDVFALISGFVGYQHQSTFRLASFVRLWLQVLFYSAGVSVLFYYLVPGSIDKLSLLKSFAPLTTRVYWYFSAYFFVILSAPVLNTIVSKYATKCLIACALGGGGVLALSHLFPVMIGPVLLVYLYFIGALLSKYQDHIHFPAIYYVGMIVATLVFTWGWWMYFDVPHATLSKLWLRNDSPTIIGVSICLVMLFCRFRPSHTLFISIITPSIFSVYLLNDHPLIRRYFISQHFSWLSQQPVYILVLYVLSFSMGFMILAILIDLIRRKIEDFLHLPALIKGFKYEKL